MSKDRAQEWTEVKELISAPLKGLLSGVEGLPQEGENKLEIEKLKQEIGDLREPLKLIEQREQKAKAWLKDIEELSVNKKNWAKEADEYARSQLIKRTKS